jgi:hypothetical protein
VGSDAGWCWSVGPGDAAGVEEDAEPVVVEASEPVAASFDLLHEQVESFGWAVAGAGGVSGEDLGLPPLDCSAEGDDLGNVIGEASSDRLGEQGACFAPVRCQVDVANRLFREPRAEDFVGWVAETEAQQEALVSSLVEAFGAGQHELADPVQRVVFAAPVPKGVVLDSAAYLVQTPVRDLHHVERIRDPSGVVQMR